VINHDDMDNLTYLNVVIRHPIVDEILYLSCDTDIECSTFCFQVVCLFNFSQMSLEVEGQKFTTQSSAPEPISLLQ